MSTTKRMTNTAFVKFLMDYSPTGALAQLFIIEAIGSYATYVSELSEEELKNVCPPMVNAEAWQKTAKHIADQLERNYGEKTNESR